MLLLYCPVHPTYLFKKLRNLNTRKKKTGEQIQMRENYVKSYQSIIFIVYSLGSNCFAFGAQPANKKSYYNDYANL